MLTGGPAGFAYEWVFQTVRMLKIIVDYSEETHHDPLVRNSTLQLCLSILNHMGFRGEFQPRAFCSKFSLLALNVRNIVILITIASNTPMNLKEKLSPLDEPGEWPSSPTKRLVPCWRLLTQTHAQRLSTLSPAVRSGPSISWPT